MSRVAEVAVRAVNSIGPQTAMALGRAAFIALLAIAVSAPLAPWVHAQRGRWRIVAWTLLLAPFFTPALLVSYAFSKFAMALIVSGGGHEALYIGVLALKVIPVAVVLRTLLPPPLSAEARHVFQMLASADWRMRAEFHLRAAGRAPWIAGGLVFLLAFADFELASLWSVKTWTMSVFDAQAGGYTLGATLRLAAWPLGVQLVILAALVFSGRDAAPPAASNEAWEERRRRRGIPTLCWLYVATSSTVVCAIPLAIVASQAVGGIPSLVENFVLGGQLGASVIFALVAAAAATVIASIARQYSAVALALVAPGLLGALIVSLLLLALFQAPLLRAFYDTPLPLAIALIVLLLPLALLLGALWLQPTPALHIARQLGSRRLIWELETRPRAIAAGILFCWAYFDFTASSILAPTGFTPVFVRLHNLAHYGQTAVLSAMMLAAFATPILVLLLTGTAWRLYARGDGR
jgi:ABC-type Fe3+ transport system permease subunit